jgi:tetratricopeptide (TPR) repeat protein
MRLKPLVAAAVIASGALTPLSASTQINSAQAKGYTTRAEAMLADGNYQGCIDQCNQAMKFGTAEREHAMWLTAVATYRAGFGNARAAISAFTKQFPQSIHTEQARLMLATLTFYDGDYAQALRQLQAISITALDLDSAEDCTYRTAFSMLKLGDYEGADELFASLETNAAKRYGNTARFYQGYIAYAQADYQRATKLLSSVNTATSPGDMAPYYLAQIRFKDGNYVEALNQARRLMASRSTGVTEEYRVEAERIAGESLYALGNETEALAILRPYLSKNADIAPLSTRYIVGVDDYATGDYTSAISLLTPVASDAEQTAMTQSAALTMGQAYLAEGNNGAALLAFEKALKMDCDPAVTETAYYNYAVARMQGGRTPFSSSVQTLEGFISRYPNSRYASTVQEYLVKGYISTDDYDGALRSINALSASRQTAQVLDAKQQVNFVLGTRALSAGNAESALTYFKAADALSSRNASIAQQNTLWTGDAYYAQGNYSAAETKYRSYLSNTSRSDANRAIATYNLGYALFGQRKYSDARTQLESSTTAQELTAATRADAYNRVGDTYYYQNSFAEAEKNYSKAYSTNPSTGDYALYQKAMMQGYQGNNSGKATTLSELTSTFPSSALVPSALTEKALTLSSQGKTKEAISVYESVASKYSSTAQGRNALLQLAILNDNAGNTSAALEKYKQVVRNYPSSSEAAMAVQDMKRIYADRGDIEELNSFLESVDGAPQLDAVERNSIAAAGLLRKAKAATSTTEKLNLANKLLTTYPDAEGAEEALCIKATAEYTKGNSEQALTDFTSLAAKASSTSMRHSARMGILRAARDMGRSELVISTANEILASSAGADSDIPEVKYSQACAYADSGKESQAKQLWTELARTPSNLYGTRAAYSLADYQYQAKQYKTAEKTINALIDANPPHQYWLARAFILLSDILRAQGSTFEADEYLKSLRENYPGTDADIFQMIDQRLSKK